MDQEGLAEDRTDEQFDVGEQERRRPEGGDAVLARSSIGHDTRFRSAPSLGYRIRAMMRWPLR